MSEYICFSGSLLAELWSSYKRPNSELECHKTTLVRHMAAPFVLRHALTRLIHLYWERTEAPPAQKALFFLLVRRITACSGRMKLSCVVYFSIPEMAPWVSHFVGISFMIQKCFEQPPREHTHGVPSIFKHEVARVTVSDWQARVTTSHQRY